MSKKSSSSEEKDAKIRERNNPLWKVVLTDAAGVGCLMLVPFLGPLPGPGGIPLLLAGFGFLAVNHDWADSAVDYVKERSESLRNVIFPDVKWIQWLWDIFCVLLLVGGTFMNLQVEHWFWKGISYGVMAGSTTLFLMNRHRIDWLDKQLRRTGKK